MDIADVDRSIESVFRTGWRAVWRQKLLFVAVSSALFAAAIVALLAVQPVYEGSTLLISGQSSLDQVPDGARRSTDTPEALARIAESEEVVGDAIRKIGLERLTPDWRPGRVSLFARMRNYLFTNQSHPAVPLTRLEDAIPRIKARLSVHSDTSSNVVRIAFRNTDPVLASAFVNELAQSFVDRHIVLFSRPGATDFFMRQREKFENDARAATDQLQRLAIQTGIYSVSDQKQLLLKQQGDLESALALTRGAITQQMGERQAIGSSLHQLAPVSRSAYVSALVDTLSHTASNEQVRPGDPRALLEREADPPLLLIKVYQDSMATLFKTNADLEGNQNLEKEQIAEIGNVKQNLNALSEDEERINELTREISRATYNADVYGKRMVEEEISAESNAARFSSLKVIQKATIPLRPATPNYPLTTLAAAVSAAIAGTAVAFFRERHTTSAERQAGLERHIARLA